jgi:hypothetical protein
MMTDNNADENKLKSEGIVKVRYSQVSRVFLILE